MVNAVNIDLGYFMPVAIGLIRLHGFCNVMICRNTALPIRTGMTINGKQSPNGYYCCEQKPAGKAGLWHDRKISPFWMSIRKL
ncbi:hypothetical protein [Thalassospira sp. MIT121401]|uniref:hypothetical protein n=1 Tax=Thalassospira sp. MIT121401 TaxID=3096989 RepID=UPI00399BDF25